MSQIENANRMEAASNDFFTRKRIITFFILTIFTIIFAVIISVFGLKINFNEFSRFMNEAFQKPGFAMWISLLFLFPIYMSFTRFFVFYIRIRKEKIYAKWWDWLFFTFIGSFLNAITPFAVGNEPYTFFWLKSKGLETRKALLILSTIGIWNPLSQIIVTWPSFFIISSWYGEYSGSPGWIAIYWISFAGLLFDLIAFSSFFALSYSRRIHFILNSAYYWIRKKVRLSYKTTAEIRNKYIEKATFKKEFLEELSDYKFYGTLIVINVLWNVVYYSSMYFASGLSSIPPEFISYNDWFNYTNIAVTANNWIPIAGAEGTLQFSLLTFFNTLIPNNDLKLDMELVNIVFIWRIFNFYGPAVIGMVCFPISAYLFIKKYK
ncbi:MAG: lysylphosphatidylglycerol synthase domain-containing protein [Mycoplasmoidaceae bacterium]